MKNLLSKCLLCLGLMIMLPTVSWADEEYDTNRGISNTTSTTHVEYYTLSGLRTESLTPGIYIHRTIYGDGKVEVKKTFCQ